MENSWKKTLYTVPEHKVDMIGDDLTLFKAKAFFLFIEVVAYSLIECRQLLSEEKDALLCHRLQVLSQTCTAPGSLLPGF